MRPFPLKDMTTPANIHTPALDSLRDFCRLMAELNDSTANRQLGADASPLTRRLLLTACRQGPALNWVLDSIAAKHLKPRLRRVLLWAFVQHFFLDGLALPVIGDLATSFTSRQYSMRPVVWRNFTVQ